jgi:hypothetical protein
MFKKVNVTTRANTYDTSPGDKPNGKVVDEPYNSTPPPSSNPLQIEKPISDAMLHPAKSVIRKAIFNPNSHATKNYNIIEYLAQAPCAMSILEVIQHCPNQRRTLLSAIGEMDLEESNLITFNLDCFKERVSHHLAFQIQYFISEYAIHHTILDEGASTCVMSLPFWRSLGSLALIPSPNTLKVFDGHGFQPHGLLKSFTMTLKGKSILVDIEVINAPLDYNLLLARSWFYAMTVVTSLMFRIL